MISKKYILLVNLFWKEKGSTITLVLLVGGSIIAFLYIVHSPKQVIILNVTRNLNDSTYYLELSTEIGYSMKVNFVT